VREVLLSVLLPETIQGRIERRVKSWGVPLPRLLEVALDRLEDDVRQGRVDLGMFSGHRERAGGGHRA
jgi:hypothetical protein